MASEDVKGAGIYIMVCIESDLSQAKAFDSKHGLDETVVHLQGRVAELAKYSLKYIPHIVVIDKDGVVRMNYGKAEEAREMIASLL